ncbi:MAG: TIM barrel protein [Kiritimatiellae bacterium]|nr:TIM barrel protein [Kiritimatiellia bacterium]
MKFALSTNWCNRKINDGEIIAAKALELGFDELELGFRTSPEQVAGFKKMLSQIPVKSIHAFCPVPVSAPAPHPELYSLASFSLEERRLASLHLGRNIEFASRLGATCVVLHAGRVMFSSLFKIIDSNTLRASFEKSGKDIAKAPYAKLLAKAKKIREKNGRKLIEIFKTTLAGTVKTLEKNGVVLGLENLPYLEGFPNEEEMAELLKDFAGAPIRPWFDTGHHRVRYMHGWTDENLAHEPGQFAGMHLNDVLDYDDDHLAPGEGKVDFAALKPLAEKVEHIVLEPCQDVTEERLAQGLKFIKSLWSLDPREQK